MDLNFSNRGLFSFDASKIKHAAEERTVPTSCGATSMTETDDRREDSALMHSALPIVRQLNLSFNTLHLFTGGETLKGLTVLDLSHNALTQLHGQSLPPTLLRLRLSYNNLSDLSSLADGAPQLRALEAGHNQLTSAALCRLPVSLVQLSAEHNMIDSLTPLRSLVRLTHVNLSHNLVEGLDTLRSLQPLVSLRHLDLRGNPICKAEAVSNADGEGCGEDLEKTLCSIAPRLSRFNGAPLSQAPDNRGWKIINRDREQRQVQERERARSKSSAATSHRTKDRAVSLHTTSSSQLQPVLEIRLMQAKVSELRRLLEAAQCAERKARQERAQLQDSVKSMAKVMHQQEVDLKHLQVEVENLREEDRLLRTSLTAAEQSFEKVHASVLAGKAKVHASSGQKGPGQGTQRKGLGPSANA